jgi:Fe-S-cluster containining protein
LAEELLHSDATVEDVALWIQERRYDILGWVGTVIPETEDVWFDIWVNPRTHDFAKRCPWLQKDSSTKTYVCTIYDLRPTLCKEWPWHIANVQKVACPACLETGQVIDSSKKPPDES